MRSQTRGYPSVYYRPNEALSMTQTSRGEHQLGSPRAHTIDFGFNERLSVDVRAENVSFIVNPKKMSLLHRLGALQLPWEWSDDAVPQQVLEKVSFSVKSGQMLAILGTSGKTAWEAPYADPDFFSGEGGGYGLPGWALRPSSSFRSEHGFFKLVKRILPSGIIIIVLYIYQKTNTNICSQMVKIKNEINIGKFMSQSCYPVYVCY